MVAKYALIVLLAFCALQGSESGVTSIAKQRMTLQEINNELHIMLQKIDKCAKEIIENGKTLVHDVGQKIKEIVDAVAGLIKEIHDDVAKRVDEIIKEIGIIISNIKPCTETMNTAFQGLVKDTNTAVSDCVEKGKDEVKVMNDKAAALHEEGQQTIAEWKSMIEKCIKDNGANIVGGINCLKGLVEPILKDMEKMVDNLQNFIEEGAQVLKTAIKDVDTCFLDVRHSFIDKNDVIIQDFRTCLKQEH